jgi:type IV secretory pathway VirB10-like protein
MSDASSAPGTTSVTDRRSMPRGVLPRGIQTWLMAGIAAVMLLIILLAGRPQPAARPTPLATPAAAPSPDRLREYQDRLRLMESRAAQEAQASASTPVSPASPYNLEPAAPSSNQDSIAADRKRREYESLFASNIVLSRRRDSERPEGNGQAAAGTGTTSAPRAAANPSIDDIADAVVRATTRAAGTVATTPAVTPQTTSIPPPREKAAITDPSGPRTQTVPISPAGPLHRLLEGTIIDTVLTNRLDGGSAAPVNCLVTNPMYSHSGQQVVIPAGARILGETRPVQAFGETRLAVAFHRLVMPDGSTHSLDHPPALKQIGDAGLRDQVNQHYWSTFGAAAAVGLISGLAQFVGTAGFNGGTGDRTVIIAGGAADAAAQASLQVMNRFLNRLPTITIREGHRIKVYLTSDLELPAYKTPAGS